MADEDKRTILSGLNVDSRTFHLVGHMYAKGHTQKQIGDRLGLKRSSVSRIVKEARKIITISYNVPGLEQLEADLIERYKLKDAIVVETGERDLEDPDEKEEQEENIIRIVGQAAARYFMENVRRWDKVGISCGSTILQMLLALPNRFQVELQIAQLSIEAYPYAIHQAPSTLVGILQAKTIRRKTGKPVGGFHLPPVAFEGKRATEAAIRYRDELTRSNLAKEIRDRARDSRLIMIGVGPAWREGDTSYAFQKIAEMVTEKRYQTYAKELKLAGEINNQVFDSEGKNRTWEIPALGDSLFPVLKLEQLQEMAAKPLDHTIVAVASGERKTSAIRVALQHGMANVIITGRADAERLLAP